MKKTLALGVLAGSLLLGSCAGTGISPGTIQSVVATVQQGVARSCGFLVNTQTTNVAAILASFLPSGAAVTEQVIAAAVQKICTTVLSWRAVKNLGKEASPPAVNGIAVHGRFVR